ncbi:hypothetical protein BAE44_0010272 [Dichanthelium oligosanthes]|uniref:WRC domain-containing protein n=1 Tax=Dichanthelium oligosanthes TaxID=888268 RepID=A0A1E5VUE3_9POAL|nr:hypothetical protein BAE44_0010272 [Dichanthelium oligosanthes]
MGARRKWANGTQHQCPPSPPPGFRSPPLELLPPPHLVSCSTHKSRGKGSLLSPNAASGERYELSRSPWDLIAELSLSDPQVEDDLLDRYFIPVTTRASWLFSATLPAVSTKKKKLAADRAQQRPEVTKKAAMSKEKENQECGQAKKKANVMQEEEDQKEESQVWNCKKNDGKRWQCHRKVNRPNSLCGYHSVQKRSYLNPDFASTMEEEASMGAPLPAASKRSTGSKP